MFRLSTSLAALAILSATALAAEPVLVLSEDFESEPYLFAHPNLSPAPGEGVGGGTALLATYVGSDVGSDRIVRRVSLPERGLDYTLNYDVRFADDFQFVGGGKLHGLGPERSITGGNERQPWGWSARVNFGRNENLRTYIYEQDGETQWGVGRNSQGLQFERGRYYAVSFHVRLNDPPEEANGHANVYVDGERVVTHENLRLRGEDGEHTLISTLLISTFHGGSSPQWAPTDEEGNYVNVHAWFDNFAVHRGRHVRPEPGAPNAPRAERPEEE